jgi:hypothetical protein
VLVKAAPLCTIEEKTTVGQKEVPSHGQAGTEPHLRISRTAFPQPREPQCEAREYLKTYDEVKKLTNATLPQVDQSEVVEALIEE